MEPEDLIEAMRSRVSGEGGEHGTEEAPAPSPCEPEESPFEPDEDTSYPDALGPSRSYGGESAPTQLHGKDKFKQKP